MDKRVKERESEQPGKWTRRDRKRRPRMVVQGKSVFRLQRLRQGKKKTTKQRPRSEN